MFILHLAFMRFPVLKRLRISTTLLDPERWRWSVTDAMTSPSVCWVVENNSTILPVLQWSRRILAPLLSTLRPWCAIAPAHAKGIACCRQICSHKCSNFVCSCILPGMYSCFCITHKQGEQETKASPHTATWLGLSSRLSRFRLFPARSQLVQLNLDLPDLCLSLCLLPKVLVQRVPLIICSRMCHWAPQTEAKTACI